jgi:hypothetical protein
LNFVQSHLRAFSLDLHSRQAIRWSTSFRKSPKTGYQGDIVRAIGLLSNGDKQFVTKLPSRSIVCSWLSYPHSTTATYTPIRNSHEHRFL